MASSLLRLLAASLPGWRDLPRPRAAAGAPPSSCPGHLLSERQWRVAGKGHWEGRPVPREENSCFNIFLTFKCFPPLLQGESQDCFSHKACDGGVAVKSWALSLNVRLPAHVGHVSAAGPSPRQYWPRSACTWASSSPHQEAASVLSLCPPPP